MSGGGVGEMGTPPLVPVQRWLAPAVAAGMTILAGVADPDGWWVLVLLVPIGVFAVWARWPRLPVVVLVPLVLGPVVAAQWRGRLEPSLFLAALIVLVVAGWEDRPLPVVIACLPAVALPLIIWAVQPGDNRVSWGIWTTGMVFTVVLSRGMRRQARLLARLADAQRRLDAQARDEERRRIARDVHDLVGHGLATVLMQVTSARHVLRRDPAAADEALAAAEEVGRRGMGDLRGTVALLREGGDPPAGPLPDLAALDALVEEARQAGLAVEVQVDGDRALPSAAVALALYRITEEALHNAARHAPRAATSISLAIGRGDAVLCVDTHGALAAVTDPGRGRYGIIGMRERAAAVGGTLEAGPTTAGWEVRCRIPT